MKYLMTLLTALLITVTLTQPLSAQEDQNDVLDPASSAFQTELQDLQLANPQLGPDHNLVFPGDVIVFADGTTHIIQPGEYETQLLLEYLQEQQLAGNQVVAIVRAGQPSIMISQGSAFEIPLLAWALMIIVTGALCFYAIYLREIRDALEGSGVNISNHQHDHFHPRQPQGGKENEDEPSELDSFIASVLFSDLVVEIKENKSAWKDLEGSSKYQNLGHVVTVSGTGNTVNVGGNSEEAPRSSETESTTEKT